MTRFGRHFLTSAFWFIAVLFVIGNLRFYSRPTVTGDHHSLPVHAAGQLNWIREELEKGSGERMQRLFPEGWFFSYLLYGLSWVELALRDPALSDEALREARWAMKHIDSPKGRAPFPRELKPDHGMFYSAWRNHLLSGIILIQPANERDAGELALFEKRCAGLADSLLHSPTPFPPSYVGQSWPCDTPPAIHSLKIRDKLMKDAKYESLIEAWLNAAREKLDPATGLLPHTAGLASGSPSSEARATSQTIILRFLADIDPEWAGEQYQTFRDHFHVTRLGIPAIREYPIGIRKQGDVDSGPLICGVSLSATAVGMGVAELYGDHEFAKAISQTGEAIGLPFGKKKRRYLGGTLPVADAFLVHATTARPWLKGTEVNLVADPVSPLWRWGIHLVSLSLLVGIWGLGKVCRNAIS